MTLLSTVIVPTRNRANHLARFLDAMARQTLPRQQFEVIIVDNGSTDDTHEIVKRSGPSLQIVYHRASVPGLHVGRHEGMRLARSDVLMFVDDDIQADPTWLEAVVNTITAPTVALVGGNNRPLFENPPPNWLRRWWDQSTYRGRALGYLSILDFGEGRFDIDPAFVWGCNFSIRREVLLKAGGFHPDAFPPELLRYRGDGETHVSEFVRRSGLRAVFNSAASVEHFIPKERMTKEYFERRAFAQGISDSYTAIRRNRGLDLDLSESGRLIPLRLRSTASRIVQSLSSCRDTIGRELVAVQRLVTMAHWQGRRFHRQEVRSDPALLEWVLQESYFE
jgi:glycosyltransferase involved in cell wall biosynthesis